MLDIMRQRIHATPDAHWFTRIVGLRAPLLLETLAHRESDDVLLRRFIENRKPPEIDRTSLPIAKIETVIAQCGALLDEIIHGEKQNAIKHLYVRKLQEILHTQFLLRSVYQNDAAAFRHYQETLFGALRTPILDELILPQLRGRELSNEHRPETRVNPVLWTRGVSLFPQAKQPQLDDRLYHAEEIALLWNHALQERFGPHSWIVQVSIQHFRVTVAARTHTIYIPSTARMSATGMRRLFAHEVNAHVARRFAGRQAPLSLLRLGTAGVHQTEEGLALMAEQITLNDPRYRGIHKYTALAIATGALDGEPRDFLGTFEGLHDYFHQKFKRSHGTTRAENLAIRHAWTHTRSIFRASDPTRDDMHFMRGKIYLEGNRDVWQYLEEHSDEEFLRLFSGRIAIEDVPLLEKFAGESIYSNPKPDAAR